MKPNKILVGRTSKDRFSKPNTNLESIENVKEMVKQYFWSGNMYMHNQDNYLNGTYTCPDFFSAGWFVQEVSGQIKQSIVVVYGSSMLDAKNKMLAVAEKLEWN